jgi:hypothetical protein
MGLQQFGHIGGDVASYAETLLGYMSPERDSLGGQSGWPKPTSPLEVWLELEADIPLINVFNDVTHEDRQKLNDALHAFHTALPFDEAERGWLGQTYNRLAEQHVVREIPGLIEGCEDHIMMAGVRRVVSGRDLMHRWIAWRREADEYEGQGSLDQAREALGSLRDLLS